MHDEQPIVASQKFNLSTLLDISAYRLGGREPAKPILSVSNCEQDFLQHDVAYLVFFARHTVRSTDSVRGDLAWRR